MFFWVKVSYQKYFCNCSQNEHRSQSVFDVRTLCYKLCLCFFYVVALFVLSTNHIRPWRKNIKTFYSTEKPSYNPPPVFPVKALKFKDVRLKLICSSVVFLLTLNMNTISLNSRFPLTYVNLMWTQSWGILTLGLVNYWLITSSDTGHSQSVSQTLATADRSWTQPCL